MGSLQRQVAFLILRGEASLKMTNDGPVSLWMFLPLLLIPLCEVIPLGGSLCIPMGIHAWFLLRSRRCDHIAGDGGEFSTPFFQPPFYGFWLKPEYTVWCRVNHPGPLSQLDITRMEKRGLLIALVALYLNILKELPLVLLQCLQEKDFLINVLYLSWRILYVFQGSCHHWNLENGKRIS